MTAKTSCHYVLPQVSWAEAGAVKCRPLYRGAWQRELPARCVEPTQLDDATRAASAEWWFATAEYAGWRGFPSRDATGATQRTDRKSVV